MSNMPTVKVFRDGQEWLIAKETKEISVAQSSEYLGYVYVVEYGNYLKIGCTKNPQLRLGSLLSMANNYSNVLLGTVLVSPPHTNYQQNERLLHICFASKRIKGELFDLTLNDFITSETKISFLDESNQLEQKTRKNVAVLKSVLFGIRTNGSEKTVNVNKDTLINKLLEATEKECVLDFGFSDPMASCENGDCVDCWEKSFEAMLV